MFPEARAAGRIGCALHLHNAVKATFRDEVGFVALEREGPTACCTCGDICPAHWQHNAFSTSKLCWRLFLLSRDCAPCRERIVITNAAPVVVLKCCRWLGIMHQLHFPAAGQCHANQYAFCLAALLPHEGHQADLGPDLHLHAGKWLMPLCRPPCSCRPCLHFSLGVLPALLEHELQSCF